MSSQHSFCDFSLTDQTSIKFFYDVLCSCNRISNEITLFPSTHSYSSMTGADSSLSKNSSVKNNTLNIMASDDQHTSFLLAELGNETLFKNSLKFHQAPHLNFTAIRLQVLPIISALREKSSLDKSLQSISVKIIVESSPLSTETTQPQFLLEARGHDFSIKQFEFSIELCSPMVPRISGSQLPNSFSINHQKLIDAISHCHLGDHKLQWLFKTDRLSLSNFKQDSDIDKILKSIGLDDSDSDDDESSIGNLKNNDKTPHHSSDILLSEFQTYDIKKWSLNGENPIKTDHLTLSHFLRMITAISPFIAPRKPPLFCHFGIASQPMLFRFSFDMWRRSTSLIISSLRDQELLDKIRKAAQEAGL